MKCFWHYITGLRVITWSRYAWHGDSRICTSVHESWGTWLIYKYQIWQIFRLTFNLSDMRAEKQRTRLEFRYLLRQPKPVVSQGETNTETSVPFCYWRYIQCLHCTRCIAGQPYYWTTESNISHAIIVCVRVALVQFILSIHRSRSEQLSISEQRDVLLVACCSRMLIQLSTRQ